MVSSLKMVSSSQVLPSFGTSVKNNVINKLILVVALIGIGILLKKIYDSISAQQHTNNSSANLPNNPSQTTTRTESHTIIRAGKTSVACYREEGDVFSYNERKIKNSTVGGTLTAQSNLLVIEDSIINKINLKYLHNNSSNHGPRIIITGARNGKVTVNAVPLKEFQVQNNSGTRQILELRNCTVGNVNFEGGDGEIILKGNSKITGHVSGGKIKT